MTVRYEMGERFAIFSKNLRAGKKVSFCLPMIGKMAFRNDEPFLGTYYDVEPGVRWEDMKIGEIAELDPEHYGQCVRRGRLV